MLAHLTGDSEHLEDANVALPLVIALIFSVEESASLALRVFSTSVRGGATALVGFILAFLNDFVVSTSSVPINLVHFWLYSARYAKLDDVPNEVVFVLAPSLLVVHFYHHVSKLL